MYQNRKNIFAAFLLLLLAGTACLFVVGCDSVLPDEFKSKNYTIDPVDARGALLLLDADNVHKVIVSRSLSSLTFVDTTALHLQTENQTVLANYATMMDSLPSLVLDTLMWVKYIPNQAVNYAILNIGPGQPKNLIIYTSLFYYASGATNNFNEYITVSIVRSDTSIMTLPDNMPTETVSGSTLVLTVAGSDWNVPIIKGRFQVQLEQEGKYLVRFTLSSPTLISNPQRTPRIDNQFKVAIIASM